MFAGRYFREFGSDRHFASFHFRDYPKGVANLHRVDQGVSLPLSPNSHYRHTSNIRNDTKTRFFQLTSQEYTCFTSLNKWIIFLYRYLLGYLSPLPSWFPSSSDKSSKFDSFACTLSTVLYLRVIDGTNFLFIDGWREYISQVFIFAFMV